MDVSLTIQRDGSTAYAASDSGYLYAYTWDAANKRWKLADNIGNGIDGVAVLSLQPGAYRFCWDVDNTGGNIYTSGCLGGEVVSQATTINIAGNSSLGVVNAVPKMQYDMSKVVVVGKAVVGQKLSVDVSSLSPEPTSVYIEWYAEGGLTGTTGSFTYQGDYLGDGPTYTVKAGDLGQQINARVYANSKKADTPKAIDGQRGYYTAKTAPVVLPMGFSSAPKIAVKKNKWRVKRVAFYVAPAVTPPGAVASFQWMRAGKPIWGQTGPTHKIVRKDRRKQLSLQVTYTYGGYETTTMITAPSRKIR